MPFVVENKKEIPPSVHSEISSVKVLSEAQKGLYDLTTLDNQKLIFAHLVHAHQAGSFAQLF